MPDWLQIPVVQDAILCLVFGIVYLWAVAVSRGGIDGAR